MVTIGRYEIDFSKIFIAAVLSFTLVQLFSWVLSKAFPSIPLFKGGFGFLILLAGTALITLFYLGKNINEIRTLSSSNKFFMITVIIVIVLAFIFLPKLIPGIFSVQGLEISDSVKNTLGSIFGGLR